MKKKTVFFVLIRAIIKLVYPKMKIYGKENMPDQNAVFVANHCKMNGPIAGELYMPENCYTWCAGQMMNLKEVADYAYADFWSEKPRFLKPFYRLLSHLIAPLSVSIFNSARTIGVYHDMRVLSTFKQTVKKLDDNKNILIFPEKGEEHNNIIYKFQERFVDVAKLMYNAKGKTVTFVPVYISPKLKGIYIGKGVLFNPDNDINEERKRICEIVSAEITQIAVNLPQHIVVPYKNLSKKKYLTNKDVNEVPR